ncbi:hypothetical protein N7468_002764 [Penicillium chermesinum]|uniref:SET domain-containing protein n=1 Tax=Penicillium chermesinum TaxID=63820 RepID=A0A9W9PKT2_9EURO|nr:uncharacterized protein N7468_002764 [Penicillium chermesinum]KAJ5247781.1 hypothetical protein N7468_002764 [Penicillium chermesinum]
MVFTASRDIYPGEECCIAYFDLTQYKDLSSRRSIYERPSSLYADAKDVLLKSQPLWTSMKTRTGSGLCYHFPCKDDIMQRATSISPGVRTIATITHA